MIEFAFGKDSSTCNENKCITSTYECDARSSTPRGLLVDQFECRLPRENSCSTFKVRFIGNKGVDSLDDYQRSMLGYYKYIGIITNTDTPVYEHKFPPITVGVAQSYLAKDWGVDKYWKISHRFCKDKLDPESAYIRSTGCSLNDVESCGDKYWKYWQMGKFNTVKEEMEFGEMWDVNVECKQHYTTTAKINSTTKGAITSFATTSTKANISMSPTDFVTTQSDKVSISSDNKEEDKDGYAATPNTPDGDEPIKVVASAAKMDRISFTITFLLVLVTLKAVFI